MIKIDSLDHNGRGIGKLDNKVVFVENALPEEIVNIKLIKDKKKYSEAKVLNYIKKSDIRIDSPCPYFNECGGCNLLHITYDEQLSFKSNKIKDIIKKYLNIDIKINNIVSSDINFKYRNKVTFQLKNSIGFYKDGSYDITPIENCLISDEIINNSIKYLKQLQLSDINKIVCRTGSNKLMIIIETKNKSLNIEPIISIADSIYLKIDNEYKLVYGNKYIFQNIGKYNYLISPDSFFQVNINVCEKLYTMIKNYIGENKKILDLYCGTGSIGIFVNEGNDVLGIEINKFAIEDANENKKINNLNNIKFICGDSGKKIQLLDFKPDVIIVDPPRSGLNRETIDNIIKLNTKELIYVSCDPMTLVRDLKVLSNNFIIKEITPFDMFPNTKHVECLVYLKNKN